MSRNLFFLVPLLALAGRKGEIRVLTGHKLAAVSGLQPQGQVPENAGLHLTIGLPLHNKQMLSNEIRQIYDPSSPKFHHYLTSAQFAEQFGPTEQDYEKVSEFAEHHGLKVTGRHPSFQPHCLVIAPSINIAAKPSTSTSHFFQDTFFRGYSDGSGRYWREMITLPSCLWWMTRKFSRGNWRKFWRHWTREWKYDWPPRSGRGCW